MNIPHTLSAIGIAASLLSGCASTPPEAQLAREMAGIQGQSPTFTNGYYDGCQSGLSAGGNTAFAYAKDLAQINQEEYKSRWEDGFRVCQSRQVQRNGAGQNSGLNYPLIPGTGVTIGVKL
jgi:poly(3-hydroxybutyrate) depolymerase